MRTEDFVVRLGGDEFLLLLPLADDEMVATVQARVREALEQWNRESPLPGANLSFAIGAAAGSSRDLDRLINEADERMYADKMRFKGHAPAALATS